MIERLTQRVSPSLSYEWRLLKVTTRYDCYACYATSSNTETVSVEVKCITTFFSDKNPKKEMQINYPPAGPLPGYLRLKFQDVFRI